MSVLVTGGAGYIGSHTVRALRSLGRDVVVLDNLDTGHSASLLGAPFVHGDITDRDLVAATCRQHGVDAIIHFAAHKNVGESMARPGKYWRNNVAGTIELVEAAIASGIERFVFSSSCSVYGTPATVPVTESAPLAPESVYAESKAMIERILGWYSRTSSLRSVSLRYFNAAGASLDNVIGEDWVHSLNLVPVVMKAVLGFRPPVQIFGDDYPTPDGTAVRDYIHVEDLADAHVRALDYLVAGGETVSLNVGTGVGSSVMEVVRGTEAASGRTVPFEIVPRRVGDPVEVYADPARVREVLGWEPAHDLATILASAWTWHSTHPDGFGE
jgi:UDP-glucose-4-epimerase GalE